MCNPESRPYFPAAAISVPLLPVLFLLLFFSWFSSPVYCQDKGPGDNAAFMAEKLWNHALDLQALGDREGAANTFLRIFQDYPRSPLGEDSLWRAIQYYKEAARNDRKHYYTLEELYRRFVAVYPDSSHSPYIYFDAGLLYYERGLYREALARFQLYLKKFPDAPLAARAEYLSAKTNIKLGQTEEARALLKNYVNSKDPEVKAKGLAGLAEILRREGKEEQALETIKRSLSLSSDFYLNYPEAEVLREFGEIYFQMGNEDYGRKHLLHYLNIVGNSSDRLDVLLELAESFHRQHMDAAAQGIYENIVEEGDKTQKAFLVARFRIAQFLDDPDNVLSKWQRRGDLTDPNGDLPYTDLLATLSGGALAQDARMGLFRRYRARQAFEDASNMARLFLRELPADEKDPLLRQAANDMLIYVVGHLVETKKYKETYDFYKIEHRHVVHYPQGHLLFLVGQALEGLYLYDQASVIYYRALGLPLSDQEKIDLYYRRARVYLAMRDFDSANRLLTYLRDIYAESPAVDEIYYLSGRLAEAKEDAAGALNYYRAAYEAVSAPSRRQRYGEAFLRILLEMNQFFEMEKVLLGDGAGENGFDPQSRQTWLLRLAEGREKSGDIAAAEKVYNAVLSAALPARSREAQKARLQLGNILTRNGKIEDGAAYYKGATEGPDRLLQNLAKERLKQMEIEQSISTLDLPK